LWVSTRNSTADAWLTPVLLPNVNTGTLEGGPALSWDGTELYFFSARIGGLGGNDLYRSTRTKLTGPQP
jgi:peptidoglycan-associated lipoprotein